MFSRRPSGRTGRLSRIAERESVAEPVKLALAIPICQNSLLT
jgi:hypothetical protein